MRYFVTGATGFIGGRVVQQLIAQGHQVTALVRNPSAAADLARLGVNVHAGDLSEKDRLREGMRGADGVFHLAGWYKVGVADKRPGARINVDGTRNVLTAMADAGVPKAVYTSTLAVFSDTRGRLVDETYWHGGPWLSEYDRTKWLAHYSVAEPMMRRGLPLVIVLPGLNYGPGDTSMVRPILVQYLQRRLPAVPTRAGYCWAHVDDTARGHLLAMERGRVGESYIIAGPSHTFVQVLDLAERLTGIPAPRLRVHPWGFRAAAVMMGLVEHVVSVPETYAPESLRSMAGVTYWGSSAKAVRELGFCARSLEEGLRETLLHELHTLGIGVDSKEGARA